MRMSIWLTSVEESPFGKAFKRFRFHIALWASPFVVWPVLVFLADRENRMTSFSSEWGAVFRMLAEWTTHPLWTWTIVFLWFASFFFWAWRAGRKIEKGEVADRVHRERELAGIKAALADATRLPAMLAQREVRLKSLELVNKHWAKANGERDEAVRILQIFLQGGADQPKNLNHHIEPHLTGLSTALRDISQSAAVPGLYQQDLPIYKAARINYIVGPGGQRIFDPSGNTEYVSNVNAYLSAASGKIELVHVYCRDEEVELSQLKGEVRQEIARLTR